MNGEVELYSHSTHKIEACLPENEIKPIAIQGLRQFCKACKLRYKNKKLIIPTKSLLNAIHTSFASLFRMKIT